MPPRRTTTRAREEVQQMVAQMRTLTGRSFFVAQQVRSYYKGSPYYRYCLAETVGDRDYKRTAWHPSYPALLEDLRKRGQHHDA